MMQSAVFLALVAFLGNGCTAQIINTGAGDGQVDTVYIQRYLAQSRTRHMDQVKEQMEQMCPDESDRLEETMLMVQECIDSIPEQTETLCSLFRNYFTRCTKPMTTLLSACVPEEAKEIPQLVMDSIVSVSNYTCRSDGEHIFELVNPCLKKQNYRLMRCERKIKAKIQQFSKKTPNKSDVCQFLQSMKPCVQSHLNYACGNEITRESFLGVYEAAMAPCNNINNVAMAENEIETLE